MELTFLELFYMVNIATETYVVTSCFLQDKWKGIYSILLAAQQFNAVIIA